MKCGCRTRACGARRTHGRDRENHGRGRWQRSHRPSAFHGWATDAVGGGFVLLVVRAVTGQAADMSMLPAATLHEFEAAELSSSRHDPAGCQSASVL